MVVFTPDVLPAKSPLFIVTHGMNQDPEYQYGSDKMYEMIDTAKFVITYLRSDGSTWDVGGTKDQNFVIKTIDEMASRYDIDKDRVYWSGFSMGSMLIHHCIAYGDDVFGYEQYGIHAYIENYAKHDKHTKYSKTTGYKTIGSSWYDGDLEKWTGGANGGEVWLYSYNNGGHWPMDLNRHLIWNFCKRFSLNMPTVNIKQPEGETTFLNIVPKEEAVFPDIAIEATAKASKGNIVKADIYDGNQLLATLTDPPYTTTLTAPEVGKHNLRVVVTDDNGKTAEASCLVNNEVPVDVYNLNDHFNTEGIVPQDWYVSSGSTTRVGGGLPFSSGPRILRFTNESRAFEYGLLIQNTSGKEKAAWAKFGVKTARSSMTLHAGHYVLRFNVYNWNQPDFSPVTVVIEDTNGQEVVSTVYTPSHNIGGKTDNKFYGERLKRFEFDIMETGDYILAFYADAERNADFVLGSVSI